MKYDFTTVLDRKGKDAIAVEKIPFEGMEVQEGFDRIPMWIADMNFPTAPAVIDAIEERLQHPCFGYLDPRKEYFDAIIKWQEIRNGVTGLTQEDIAYENGVLGGIVNALQVISFPGDSILVHSPIYVGFTSALSHAGFNIVHSPLKQDEKGIWRMDYEDMDAKLKANQIHTAIFCSPHNPCGRVWERWEIEKAMEIYKANDVYVISDEIWSDLTLEDHKHIPTQTISEDAKQRTLAFYATTKTFSLAGLVGSYHIVYNTWIRDQIRKKAFGTCYNNVNVLSMYALIGAYGQDGQEWTDELKEVIAGNVTYACDFIRENFPGVEVMKPEATYMLFLDCTKWCEEHGKSLDDILKAGVSVGVIWQDGRPFLGQCHIRMNLALPLSRVQEAFERLRKYVFC